jgi:hypothetical protein
MCAASLESFESSRTTQTLILPPSYQKNGWTCWITESVTVDPTARADSASRVQACTWGSCIGASAFSTTPVDGSR